MIWKNIEGFPDYQISDLGLVKSLQRRVLTTAGTGIPHLKTINEKILKPAIRNGYLFVTLRRNNGHKANMIHQMVADAFVGVRIDGLVVNHKNGNKLDNRAENLEICSKAKNTQHYFNSLNKCIGGVPIGDIPEIIKRISRGFRIKDIAEEYRVTRNDIAVLNKVVVLNTGEELKVKELV